MQKIQTLVLLLTAYAAATWFPGPGQWLRELNVLTHSVQPPQILLAALLFSAGVCSSQGAIRTILNMRTRFILLAGLAWLLPLLSAAATVSLLWGLLGCPASVALGVLVVAAMPVANSSVGWSTSMGGSVPLSIALLVVGTALSPVLSPLCISAGATAIGTAEGTLTQSPWSDGMGQFFLLWVLLPVLSGVALAGRLNSSQRQWLLPVARRLSFALLILLNYLNAAACLPALAEQPGLLLWPLLAAGVLLTTAFGCSQIIVHLPCGPTQAAVMDSPQKTSLLLSVVMRNTGAALVFAGAALPQFVLVSVTIIAYTMLQHLCVGLLLTKEASAIQVEPACRTASSAA